MSQQTVQTVVSPQYQQPLGKDKGIYTLPLPNEILCNTQQKIKHFKVTQREFLTAVEFIRKLHKAIGTARERLALHNQGRYTRFVFDRAAKITVKSTDKTKPNRDLYFGDNYFIDAAKIKMMEEVYAVTAKNLQWALKMRGAKSTVSNRSPPSMQPAQVPGNSPFLNWLRDENFNGILDQNGRPVAAGRTSTGDIGPLFTIIRQLSTGNINVPSQIEQGRFIARSGEILLLLARKLRNGRNPNALPNSPTQAMLDNFIDRGQASYVASFDKDGKKSWRVNADIDVTLNDVLQAIADHKAKKKTPKPGKAYSRETFAQAQNFKSVVTASIQHFAKGDPSDPAKAYADKLTPERNLLNLEHYIIEAIYYTLYGKPAKVQSPTRPSSPNRRRACTDDEKAKVDAQGNRIVKRPKYDLAGYLATREYRDSQELAARTPGQPLFQASRTGSPQRPQGFP